MPSAMRPVIEIWRSTLKRLSGVRKFGFVTREDQHQREEEEQRPELLEQARRR